MKPDATDEITRFVEAIKGHDWDVRNRAEQELASHGSAAVSRMVELLRDESWIARMVACRVIARVGSDALSARDSVKQLLEVEEDDWVRRNAEWALRQIGGQQ